MSDYQKLLKIQKDIVCGKGQYNSFGKYKFRSYEDILKAFNELDNDCVLILSDDIVLIGERYYLKTTATLIDSEDGGVIASNTGFAREALEKKGMDEAQITGSASSYARKYALCGLFALDGEDDADKLNTNKEYTAKLSAVEKKTIEKQKQSTNNKGVPVDIATIDEILLTIPSKKGWTAQQIYDYCDKKNWYGEKSNKPITAQTIKSFLEKGWL